MGNFFRHPHLHRWTDSVFLAYWQHAEYFQSITVRVEGMRLTRRDAEQ